MAKYMHLNIYKDSYRLMLLSTKRVSKFPREYKFSIGQKIRDEITEIIVLIYKANSTEKKTSFIKDLLERLQVVGLLLRLSKDLAILSLPHFAELSEVLDSIGKQSSGWLKSNLAQQHV